jgi:ribosomal protein L24E
VSQIGVNVTLRSGDAVRSADSKTLLVQQSNGNLVVIRDGRTVWTTGVVRAGATTVMQSDGNLVTYQGGVARWSSKTNGKGATRLVVQNDGNVVLYTSANRAVWATNTVRPAPQPPAASGSVVQKAQSWVAAKVPYSQSRAHTNQYGSYRADCSGLVSMAWGLSPTGLSAPTTVTLATLATKITKNDLRAGDILLNKSAGNAGHAVIFVRWSNAEKTRYVGIEQNGAIGYPVEHVIQYPYWSGNGVYEPYRKR